MQMQLISTLVFLFQSLDLLTVFEKFGYPTAISIFIVFYFSRKIDKKDKDYCDLQDKTIEYLKSQVDKEYLMRDKRFGVLQTISHGVQEIRKHQGDFECENFKRRRKTMPR